MIAPVKRSKPGADSRPRGARPALRALIGGPAQLVGRRAGRGGTSSDKMLSIIDLFTPEAPDWTVEAIALRLQLSGSTAYRYVRSLTNAGLIFSVRPGHYLLGPGIIYYDRLLRLADPLIRHAEPLLRELSMRFDMPGVLFVARMHHQHVMPILEVPLTHVRFPTRYLRGALIPVALGAPELAILAFQPIRSVKRHHLNANPGSHARSSDAWRALKRAMRETRSRGYALDLGGIDPGVAYIAAPLRRSDDSITGSLVLGMSLVLATPELTTRTARLLQETAQTLSERIESEVSDDEAPPRESDL